MTTETAYNADGHVSTITAVNARTGNQTTQFLYGSTLSDSTVASSLLKVAEVYPDSSGPSDRITFKYNRQQEATETTNQAGTTRAFDYDKLGRVVQDRATALGSGIDGAVRRIATAYEVRGMVAKVTSYDNATVGSGSIVNEVQMAYDSFAQPTADYQSHMGTVNTTTTPKVGYLFVDGIGNTSRAVGMTYPNGRTLSFDYGTSGGMEDALSRVAALLDGATQLADYSYLGLGAVIEQSSSEPQLRYSLIGTAGGDDPDTGDIYRGLDRFGRIKDLMWRDYGRSFDAERVKYGYDRASNLTWRENATDTTDTHDELYANDGLNRLNTMGRGGLNASKSALTTNTFGQCWALDPVGNWRGFRQNDTGSGSWSLVQSRTSNAANEITSIYTSVGSAWATPGYDAAGHMTTIPKPGMPTGSFTGTYDPWSRLVKLADGAATLAAYAYDGFDRRTVKQTYSGGVLSETRHVFYTVLWQAVEERISSSSNAERQFVWGVRYLDDLVLRDRDTDASGSLDERLYAMQDANFNVTAIADSTGVVVERNAYDAYGMPSVLTPGFWARSSSLYAWETLYAGYRWDRETAMYNVRNRVYNGVAGWLQRDPAVERNVLNLYAYASGAPTNRIDPFGDIDLSYQWSSSANTFGLSLYFSCQATVTSCPYEVELSVFGGGEWQPPGLRWFQRLLSWFGFDKWVHSEAGLRAGVAGKIKYSECSGITDAKVCVRVEAFARIEIRRGNVRDSQGRFTRSRFGGGASGNVDVCINFCDGEVTLEGSIGVSLYANFGYNVFPNRTYNFGTSISGSFTLGKFRKLAVLEDYCNAAPDPGGCGCRK